MAKGGFQVFDSDMHVLEPPDMWERYIDPEFRDRAPRCQTTEPRDMTVEVEGQLIPVPQGHRSAANIYQREQAEAMQAEQYKHPISRSWDSVSQLDAMDEEGLDVAVLYPSRGLMPLAMDGLDPALGGAIATAYNNWLSDFCQADPKRMYGAAMLSVHDVESAVQEVRRCVKELGFKGVFLRPNVVAGRNWHDPYYDPLWAEIQDLGIPLGFHEGGRIRLPQIGNNFESSALYHTCSHPMGMMIAMVSMIGGGVLDRFPNLTVAFLEANCSWVPWMLWRLNEHLEPGSYASFLHLDLKLSAIEYFKRQCYTSVECDEEPAKYMVDWVGDDNVLFSTDYPHLDSKFPEAVDRFLEMPFPDDTKRKFLWDNCSRYYNLS